MTLTPEEALESQLLRPPLTKTPLSFLEWSSACSGIIALMAETLRRLFPSIQDGNGYLVINTLIVVAMGVVCIQGIPILTHELTSKRRGSAEYYMVALLVFCLAGSAMEMQKDLKNHFLGILPILFAGYGITKRKYREYYESLQNAADGLESGGGPKLEILEESKQWHTVGIESVKAGDFLKVSTGNRIWVAAIIHQGYGLLNQASPQSTPVPRRCGKGDTVSAGEILIEGDLIIQATENGNSGPKPEGEDKTSWLDQFQSLVFNRQQKLLRIIWVNFIVFIICAQFLYSQLNGGWQGGVVPAVSLLIGLNPWGIVMILPLLWRRRFTVTAYKGIQFRNLKLVELFSNQLEIVLEKTGILTEPGISRKKIILSKHFRGKSPFLIRSIRAIEEAASLSLGAHYFSRDTNEKSVTIKQIIQSEKGTIEAEIFDEEERRIFIRVGSLRSMPYFTHNGFKQLNAQVGEIPPRQRLFVTLNDIPAAIFVWDERIKEEGLELLKEASANGLKVTIVTKDSGTKLETLNDHPIRKVASAKEKMDIVQAIEKNKKRVLYLGYGRNDIPALSAASGSMMVENGDPYALPYSDAVVTKDGLKLLVGEWLRFKKARSIAKYITLTASIQAVIILLLTLTRTLNPWLATLLTGITGTVMMVQTLRVEK
jgi:cation transport ATPase